MTWFILALLACQVFYYEDETTKDIQLAKVSSNYNNGINAAMDSSVRIDLYSEHTGQKMGHGSGNLFKIGSKHFIITAAHVVQRERFVVIREQNGNLLPGMVAWANLQSDIAIIIPMNKDFEITKAVSYVNNKKRSLVAEKLWHHSYPSDIDGFLAESFVSKSGYFQIVMQSQAWFGSSGGVVFDQRGRAVGVVHAINVESDPIGMPNFMETMVYVNRLYDLSRKDILGIIADASTEARNPN